MESVPPSRIADITGYLFFLEGVFGYIVSPILLLIWKNTSVLIITAGLMNLSAMVIMAWIKPGEGVRWFVTHGKFE
jgi:hypothetical protein